jgi:antitoxin (DNA-binding transcriptional repressor) of toxin-antitoxin stability system
LREGRTFAARSTVCYTMVVREISQRELRNESGQIMRELEAGESFIVTRGGTPVGELLPLRRRRTARLATVLEIFRGAPRVDYKRLRRDLDKVANPDPKPRA